MGCNCGGSGARKQRGSAKPSSARQQPGFWAPATPGNTTSAPAKTAEK